MPLPTTLPHSLVATENMKTLKRENTSFESVRSSRHPSPQLSSPQQEAWASFTPIVLSSTGGNGHPSPQLSSPQREAWASFTPIVLSSTGGMGILHPNCPLLNGRHGHPSPQLSSPQREAMGNMATTDNGAQRTVRPWGGFAAVYPFSSCDRSYGASEEHDQIKDTSLPLLN